MGDVARVFVGSDRSQLIGVRVLEHSIRRHTDMAVELRSMHDVRLPDPKDIRQGKRTGFSFTRFAIPQLAGYSGRAVYLDADMLVFRDFRELWTIPFDDCKIVIQEEIPDAAQSHGKMGAPGKRIKQCAVMLLDCAALDWDPVKIIAGLDGDYTYEELLNEMCILPESDVKYGVPFHWNSLEFFEPGATGLIHYTDMMTQPWVSARNKNGYLWLNEVRLMLSQGALGWDDIRAEVELGYVRPSILEELKRDPEDRAPDESATEAFEAIDREAGFEKHKEVYAAKRARKKAVKQYEAALKGEAPLVQRVASSLRRAMGRQEKGAR